MLYTLLSRDVTDLRCIEGGILSVMVKELSTSGAWCIVGLCECPVGDSNCYLFTTHRNGGQTDTIT